MSFGKNESKTTQQMTDPEAARRMAGVAERAQALGEEQWGLAKELYMPYERALVESNQAMVKPNEELMLTRMEEGTRDITEGRALKDETRAQRLREMQMSEPVMSAFYDEVMKPVDIGEREAEAVRVWPVRSGLSKRSFSVVTRIREDVIEVAIQNDAKSRRGFYAYKIKNSVRTRESLEKEALQWSRRGQDPSAQARIFDFRWRQLRRIHGEGARSAAEAGRNSWSVYVRKPAEQRRSAIVAELQADLAKLAQPAGGQ